MFGIVSGSRLSSFRSVVRWSCRARSGRRSAAPRGSWPTGSWCSPSIAAAARCSRRRAATRSSTRSMRRPAAFHRWDELWMSRATAAALRPMVRSARDSGLSFSNDALSPRAHADFRARATAPRRPRPHNSAAMYSDIDEARAHQAMLRQIIERARRRRGRLPGAAPRARPVPPGGGGDRRSLLPRQAAPGGGLRGGAFLQRARRSAACGREFLKQQIHERARALREPPVQHRVAPPRRSARRRGRARAAAPFAALLVQSGCCSFRLVPRKGLEPPQCCHR